MLLLLAPLYILSGHANTEGSFWAQFLVVIMNNSSSNGIEIQFSWFQKSGGEQNLIFKSVLIHLPRII